MVSTSTISTIFGVTDTIINNEGGSLNNVNTAAQLGAVAASYTDTITGSLNPVYTATSITASNAALATSTALLTRDIIEYDGSAKSKVNISADVLTVLANSAMLAGSMAAASNSPAAKILGVELKTYGDIATLVGVGIRNRSDIIDGIPIILQEVWDRINDSIGNIKNSTARLGNNFSSSQSSQDWSALISALGTGFNYVGDIINNAETPEFINSVSNLQSHLNDLPEKFINVFDASNITLSDITTNITGDKYSISNDDGSLHINADYSFSTDFGLDGSFGTLSHPL